MNDILITGDDEQKLKTLKKQLVLLRISDKSEICNIQNIKKFISKDNYKIIIFNTTEDYNFNIKTIEQIKNTNPNIEVIISCSDTDENIINYYDAGAFSFIDPNSSPSLMLITVLNCMKYITQKNINLRNNIYLEQTGLINLKNNCLYKEYLEKIFSEIITMPEINKGTLCILTLDENAKTKVALNRLAGILQKNIRKSDILSVDSNGDFYIVFSGADINYAENIILNIQSKMGQNSTIRCGGCKIGFQQFKDAEKIAKDSLESAIINNKTFCAIKNNYIQDENWIENSEELEKPYKIFQTLYDKKVKNIIEPTFYNFKKEYEKKFKDAQISQYANNIESAFCIKTENSLSEFLIRYNKFTKVIIQIQHSGLETAENSKEEIEINKITLKELQKRLKKFTQDIL